MTRSVLRPLTLPGTGHGDFRPIGPSRQPAAASAAAPAVVADT
ncbi:hypothetical protein [Allocatelliglobosispora scoriae]|nr:hypothetical protein [Allocatelliglobosispora scoriae]